MPADLTLLDEIYNFCMARARERASGKVGGVEGSHRSSAQSEMKWFQQMRLDIRARPWSAAEGIDYFRGKAMKYRDHPDYRPEWTLPEK